MNTQITDTQDGMDALLNKQMEKGAEYVRENKGRLVKQFGDKHIAVRPSDVKGDVRKGIVVDSDADLGELYRRLCLYGILAVGTIEELTKKEEPVTITSLDLSSHNIDLKAYEVSR